MVKLRDYFESDLETFINVDEFGEVVDIEGHETKVVMDSDGLKEMQLSNNGEGLASSELLFHVKKTDLHFRPFPKQDILFNGELYYINDIKEDEGMYAIVLGVAKA